MSSALMGAREIADYIQSLSPYDVDTEFIEEMFFQSHATLTWITLDQIKEGDPDVNIRDEEKENRYAQMPSETCPPIMVEDGVIVDGHHRFRAAVKNGCVGIWAYCVKDGPAPKHKMKL